LKHFSSPVTAKIPGLDQVNPLSASRHGSQKSSIFSGTNVQFVTYLRWSGRPEGMALNQNVPTILVIEDEDEIQSFIEDALTDGGFYPAIAASGEEAVTLLQAHKGQYHALVTDISLRGRMDGWAVAQHARENDPEFPVIYISGASAADWPSKGVPNSIMLQKPFAPAQLLTAVSQLLNSCKPSP
jgi:CheY-like chemotaxis protein